MRPRTKVYAVLGVAFAAYGMFTLASVQAVEGDTSEQKPEVEEQVLHAYGDSLVIAQEPVESMFSHSSHVIDYEFSCDTCHPDIFEKRRGAAEENGDYTMASFEEGMYCGACHDDSTAFSTTDPDTCVTCHGSDMVAPETVVFTKPVKAVIFGHQEHVDMGLECSSCHSDVFEMRVGAAEEKPEEFVMQALYDGKYCGSCHNGDDAFASDTMCNSCHIGVKGYERLHGDGEQQKDAH